jgi:hypothetical protein
MGFPRRAQVLGVKAEPLPQSTQAMIDQLCAVARPAGD